MDFPTQVQSTGTRPVTGAIGNFDMRNALYPRRLTMVMWDNAFLLRHGPGGSFEDFDRVLGEAEENGYNCLRLDPMPQWVDLTKPERRLKWADPKRPYMPWNWNSAVDGPVGEWLIEFMEKVNQRRQNYTLSAWWACDENPDLPLLHRPKTHLEAAEVWAEFLRNWKARFGFSGLLYVDIANEVPYFLPGFMARYKEETGFGWSDNARFTGAEIAYLAKELNEAMSALQREFPELRFTASIHGDTRWVEVPLEFDCLDAHFYADADRRWTVRTKFHEYMKHLFTSVDWHADFSQRCQAAHKAVAPMLRARQRSKLSQFAAWSQQRGMPLTTTESWATWYYIDSPDLDWGWLLEWAEWSVEDALEFGMWGWTPHNYCQPQFANWKDTKWHQRLTRKFLNG